MGSTLKLLCVLAHPDDESLGLGGMLAKYASEGIETHLITATRGERGWFADDSTYPGLEALGKDREAELLAAARVLGIRRVYFLDYIDGELDQVDPGQAVAKIVGHVRRVKPQVVISFGPDGGYGHPDHIAISQFTAAALVCAADPNYVHSAGLAHHRVSKLYYTLVTKQWLEVYQAIFGDVVMHIDGVERRGVAWPDWAITTRIDTWRYWRTVWQAVCCHRLQLPAYHKLEQVSEEQSRVLWGAQTAYRAFSLVNGGRTVETDLFGGLR
jgi:LmbE family N-acetylglucosaminyl deacetylase